MWANGRNMKATNTRRKTNRESHYLLHVDFDILLQIVAIQVENEIVDEVESDDKEKKKI